MPHTSTSLEATPAIRTENEEDGTLSSWEWEVECIVGEQLTVDNCDKVNAEWQLSHVQIQACHHKQVANGCLEEAKEDLVEWPIAFNTASIPT